jgi:peptidoglycan L-alanyl-D-glutamate endopeptidase CwlK
MRKYSVRSKRNLKGIHPDLRRVIDRALQESPLDFMVIEGLRTKERQKRLVASGASRTMNSRHITGHAVDLLPIGPDGPAFDWPLYHKLGPAVKEAAQAEGVDLEWGGDWRSFKDGPHFQLSHKRYPASEWATGDKPPMRRTHPAQSTTMQAAIGTGLAGAGGVATSIGKLDPAAQYIVLGCAGLGALFLIWIMRERLRKWLGGDR